MMALFVFLQNVVFGGDLQELDDTQVRLLPGSPFYERQELHRRGYLASFQPDKLLFHYRALAKLPQAEGVTSGYAGWDSGFIRGHMAGHYLSAASRMAAATGDASFKEKADYMVAELAKCQIALNQDGYLAAFSSGAFDRLEGKPGNGGGVVVPYYTIHKIMAGLLDAHHYLGNTQALDAAVKMATYFENRLASLKPEEVEKIFRTDGSRNRSQASGNTWMRREYSTVRGLSDRSRRAKTVLPACTRTRISPRPLALRIRAISPATPTSSRPRKTSGN
jgi:hypothetical protein